MGTGKIIPKSKILNGHSNNIVLALTMMMMMMMVTHSSGFQLEIRNEMRGRYRRLVYKCWSLDDDLGWRTNWPGQKKRWSFTMSVFNTSFYCNFRTAYGRADRQLVASWRMKENCGDRDMCTWVAKKDGLYLRKWRTKMFSNKYGTEQWHEYKSLDMRLRIWSL